MPPNAHLSTAVLVFALSPLEEMANKPIPKAGDLYKELTRKTIQTVEQSGLSYFHFTEHDQRGSSFGERFSNAIETIFAHGFENVITIGNDSPALKVSHLIDASLHLEQGEFVMGPSKDGGFYLMGINKSMFDANKFINILWQTNNTASQVIDLIKENRTTVVQLETLTDLDNTQDLKDFIKFRRGISSQLLNLIHTIIGLKTLNPVYSQTNYNRDFKNHIFNKGSPLVVII